MLHLLPNHPDLPPPTPALLLHAHELATPPGEKGQGGANCALYYCRGVSDQPLHESERGGSEKTRGDK